MRKVVSSKPDHSDHPHSARAQPQAESQAPENAPAGFGGFGNIPRILEMQALYGNQAVLRMYSVQRDDGAPAAPAPAAPAPAAPAALLTSAQVTEAHRYYNSQAQRYTPEIINRIQTAVGVQATGTFSDDDIQAIARWQQRLATTETPSLSVDGKVGPNTMPTIFSQGLADQNEINQFGEESREILGRWTELATPEARINALVAKVNEYLTRAGVPICTATIGNAAGNLGQFEFETWTLDIGRPAFAVASPTDDQKADMANTIYHESRHAEQWFRMAQYQASQGRRTAARIARDMGIPVRIATAALANPLVDNTVESVIAQGWNDSVYGAGAEHRNQVLTELSASGRALNVAQTAADARSTPANQRRLAAAQARNQRARAAYFNLPEENDANRIGDRVTNAYNAAAL